MSESKKLTQQVEEINAQLRALGRTAVQEIKMMKEGQVIGQIRYGYKPQYVFDAVNPEFPRKYNEEIEITF